jgi:hypothetical protein
MDYMFQWVNPDPGETYFKCWVCPATMVFENANEVGIEIESRQGFVDIAQLYREAELRPERSGLREHLYRFECQEGVISLRATGYRMYVRQRPRLTQGQHLELEVRGGISFDQLACP